MEISNYFFLVFLIAILATRVWSVSTRIASPTVGKFRTHHYMYGLVLIVFSVFFSNITFYAIGLGLFVDQLPLFVLWRKWLWEDYISRWCYVGIIFIAVLVYILRNYILYVTK